MATLSWFCTSSLWHRLGEPQGSKELTAITCPALFPVLSSWNTTTHCYGYAGFDTQLRATSSIAKSAPPDHRRNPAQAACQQQLLPVQLFPCTSLPPASTHCRTKSLSTVHTGKKHNYTHTLSWAIHNYILNWFTQNFTQKFTQLIIFTQL